MATLVALTGREEKNDDDGMKMQCDQRETHFLAFELQLRIQRCAAFAPQYGDRASKLADDSFSLVNKLVADKEGRREPIFQKLYEFNQYARQAHAEILALSHAKR